VVLALSIGVTLLLWASAFSGIRVGLSGYAPQHLVLLRLLTASVALFFIAHSSESGFHSYSMFPRSSYLD
jgi:hypothetical protein